MPLIKPRTRGKQMVRRIVRFDRETNETLFAYAHFLGESTDYVLNEVIDTVLAKDKEFLAWRAEHTRVVRAAATGQPAGHESAAPSAVPMPQPSAPTCRGRTVGRARLMARQEGEATVIRDASCEQRALVAMLIATGVGVAGVHAYPVDRANVYLQLIELRNPAAFLVLVYGYATLWFTTPFFAASMLGSLTAIVAYRRSGSRQTARRCRPTSHRSGDRRRRSCSARAIFETTSGRAPQPAWLTIPQRGLYTGVMILGAVGTGKTSACMYPYVDQLLRWSASDPERKIGGLVLEVKGDFCRQVRGMLARAGRATDYIEIGLDTGVCYNPLHNDLDPYAVAYAIATLLNNLFGKSKEPFWQQAYTDLLKFVILLRRITDGYTTLRRGLSLHPRRRSRSTRDIRR